MATPTPLHDHDIIGDTDDIISHSSVEGFEHVDFVPDDSQGAANDNSASTASSIESPYSVSVKRNYQMANDGLDRKSMTIMSYNNSEIKFAESIPDSYNCSICLNILYEPIQTNCGHRFCKKCLEPIKSGQNPRCPNDRQSLMGSFTDRHCAREIDNLQVFCTMEPKCPWTGTLMRLEDHLTKCVFVDVTCPNTSAGCHKQMAKYELTHHIERECSYREVGCNNCGALVVISQMEHHNDILCPKMLIVCQNGNCKERFARMDLALHEQVCKEVMLECDIMDCGEKVKRGNMKAHVTADDHLESLFLDYQKMKQVTAEQSINIDNTAATVVALQDKITRLENHMSLHGRPNCDTGTNPAEQTVELNQEIEVLKSLITIETMDRKTRCASIEHNVALLERNVHQLQPDMPTSYDGTLIWKISGFKKLLNDAKSGLNTSFYSQPFYSGVHGYKACARLYPNGDGEGRSRYLSLFIAIMKGDYDAILSWPFKHRITLTLMDQSSLLRNDITETFIPDGRSSSFKQPTDDLNLASGCPRFVLHEVLYDTNRYLKGDTIFLKVHMGISNA